MKWYIQAIKNYSNFSGRASRKEYWMFFLFNVIFGVIAGIIDKVIGFEFSVAGKGIGYGIVGILYSLFVLIPGLSVQCRRLHDINKSAGWIFISLVPCIGTVVLFIFSVMSGTIGANNYGAAPKAE